MDLHDFLSSSEVENLQEMELIPIFFFDIFNYFDPTVSLQRYNNPKKIVSTLLDGSFKDICAPMFFILKKNNEITQKKCLSIVVQCCLTNLKLPH
jgi:hypothetical protein